MRYGNGATALLSQVADRRRCVMRELTPGQTAIATAGCVVMTRTSVLLHVDARCVTMPHVVARWHMIAMLCLFDTLYRSGMRVDDGTKAVGVEAYRLARPPSAAAKRWRCAPRRALPPDERPSRP